MKLHNMLGHASAERCVHVCQCSRFPGIRPLISSDHPQPELSQRPVLSESDVRIYSTPVKDVTTIRSRLWEVQRLAPEKRKLSRVSQRQKELDESMLDRDLEEGNKRPRDDSEGCPHPDNKLNGTSSTKKRRDVSELDQHLMDVKESDPIHTDDSEVCFF